MTPDDGLTWDLVSVVNGPVVVHPASQCAGRSCCIHNPSQHPLSDRPLFWRQDRQLMERLCEHDVGHPDPDDLAFKQSHMDADEYRRRSFGVHGCDGCCSGTCIRWSGDVVADR